MPLLYPIQVNGQPVWHSKKGFCLPSRERVAEWQKKHPNGDKMAQYQRERDEARAREPDTGKPKKGRPRKPPPVEWYEDRDRGSDDEDSDDELTGISGEVEAEINDEDMQEGELESPSRGQTLEEEQEQIEAADELAGHRWGAKRARSEALQSARMRYKSINHIVGTEASTSRPGTSCADLSDQGYEDTFEVLDPYVLFAAEILASIEVRPCRDQSSDFCCRVLFPTARSDDSQTSHEFTSLADLRREARIDDRTIPRSDSYNATLLYPGNVQEGIFGCLDRLYPVPPGETSYVYWWKLVCIPPKIFMPMLELGQPLIDANGLNRRKGVCIEPAWGKKKLREWNLFAEFNSFKLRCEAGVAIVRDKDPTIEVRTRDAEGREYVSDWISIRKLGADIPDSFRIPDAARKYQVSELSLGKVEPMAKYQVCARANKRTGPIYIDVAGLEKIGSYTT